MLDELVADFIRNTRNTLSNTSVMDLMSWSFQQTVDPDEPTL